MNRAPELTRKRKPAKPAGEPAGGQAAPDEREARDDLDAKIDEAVAESFPASDPPAWTPGVV